MSLTQQVITIAMVVLGTVLTRFIPFILFPASRPVPKFITYLGKALPSRRDRLLHAAGTAGVLISG